LETFTIALSNSRSVVRTRFSFTLGVTLARMVPMLGALGFGSVAVVIGSLFSPAQVLIPALEGQSEEDDGDVVADPAASDAETLLLEAEPQAPEKRRAMKESPAGVQADTQRPRRRDVAERARSHVKFKLTRVAMQCADIGSMCGHLIANQGKWGHIISIYPDAIPMSRSSIRISQTAIPVQTALVLRWRSAS